MVLQEIKTHLSKIEGHDITPCPNVPYDIIVMFINEVASRERSLQLKSMFVIVFAITRSIGYAT